jgi:hypothetical protein
MRIRKLIPIGLVVGYVMVASSLALYYRYQAGLYQREWKAARAELDRVAESVTSASFPDAAPTRPRASAVRRNADVDSSARVRPTAELQVVAKDTLVPSEGASLPARAPAAERFGRRGADWMENLRTNDPQRYAEMQQRRQERQQSIQNAWVQATNYFMNRDTSTMSDQDLEEYSTMVTLLGQAWSLNQQVQSGLPPEERQQAYAALRSNVMAVVPLLDNERNREYYDLARAMGQSDEAAAALVNSVNQIASNTSLRTILPGIRIGGMSGGPGPGGPPPLPASRVR